MNGPICCILQPHGLCDAQFFVPFDRFNAFDTVHEQRTRAVANGREVARSDTQGKHLSPELTAR